MSKHQWSCPIIMDVHGPKDFTLCGFKCATEASGNDHPRIAHLTDHNPSPAQWAQAYKTMQQWKDQAKKPASA